jgi:peptidoglycan/xylan/chitin deacetylase (PgdA/CDA1 family)
MADITASGLITITFDDGVLSQLENGYPVLNQNRVKGVVFIPTGFVGGWFEGQPSMSLNQLRELSSVGWEIGSHTVSHARLAHKDGRTRLALTALEAEVRESREWLVANGFSVMSFAYPAGRYNDEVEGITARYYRYIRTSERGLNEVSSGRTRLKVFNLCQKNIDQWQQAIDVAVASKKWLIPVIHRVAEDPDEIPSGQESLWIARGDLAECLQYALSSGLPVRTFQEVDSARQGRDDAAESILLMKAETDGALYSRRW